MNTTRRSNTLTRRPAPPVSVHDDPTAPGVKRVVLRGRLTVADAIEFHRLALGVEADNSAVVVDCTQVEHLDAAAVQVVIALGRAVEGSGRRCVVEAGEAAAIFRLAGLGAIVSG